MRKKNLFISVMTLLSFVMYSCSTNEEVYSCNPDADAWAKNNLKGINVMDREGWLKIDKPAYRKAAYAAFTAHQKQAFWIFKINEILKFDWSAEEKTHLLKLLSFITEKKDIFENGMDDEDEIWSYKWLKYGKEVLKWDKDVLFNIAMNGDRVTNVEKTSKNQSGIRLKTRTEHGGSQGSDPTCNCRVGKDDCQSDQECRKASVYYCNMTYCGFLYLHVCNGKCK